METARMKLPVGIENFEEIRTEGFYYVDKTSLIADLLHNWGKVNLFTRPRRFGKSLNMSMLRTFLEIGCDSRLFDGLIFTKLVVPLGKPIVLTISLFTGLNYWNDWTNGLYYVNDARKYTIQVLLNKMIENINALQSGASSVGSAGNIPSISVRMAIAFIALIPILILYPFLQKYFEKGIMLGAVKG